MLDLNYVRENLDKVLKALEDRHRALRRRDAFKGWPRLDTFGRHTPPPFHSQLLLGGGTRAGRPIH